jgi:hypothetical protein
MSQKSFKNKRQIKRFKTDRERIHNQQNYTKNVKGSPSEMMPDRNLDRHKEMKEH